VAISLSVAFGKAVREERRERGLSQEEAALAVGMDRGYFGSVERAEKSPTLTTVAKVAEALRVPPSKLMTRAEEILGRELTQT
jgi:transcriptional regulator with XRE-family HTH domain